MDRNPPPVRAQARRAGERRVPGPRGGTARRRLGRPATPPMADGDGETQIGEGAHVRECTIDRSPSRFSLGYGSQASVCSQPDGSRSGVRISAAFRRGGRQSRSNAPHGALADHRGRLLRTADELLDRGVCSDVGDPDGERDLVPLCASSGPLPSQRSVRVKKRPCTEAGRPSRSASISPPRRGRPCAVCCPLPLSAAGERSGSLASAPSSPDPVARARRRSGSLSATRIGPARSSPSDHRGRPRR